MSITSFKPLERIGSAGRRKTGALLLFALICSSGASVAADALSEARAAYGQQKYEEALKILDPLVANGKAASEALELRVRTYLKLKQPEKAVPDYLRWADHRGKDDARLLRELAFQVIAAAVGDMREQMRGAAVTALKEMGGADTLPALEAALADQSGLVRALAVEGVAHGGRAAKSKRLRKLLYDPAAIVRVAALRALGESGDRALVPEIEPLLKDGQPRVQAAAGAALAALGRPEALSQALETLKNPKPDERAAALRILGHVKDERVTPALLNALSDREATVRATAAGILAERGGADAASAVAPLLKDPVPMVRGVAAAGLSKLEGAKAAALIEPMLQDSVPLVRAEAAAALLPYRPASAGPIVRESMQSPDPGVRSAVAKALGQSGNAAIPYLLDLLNDQTPRPRISAIRSLGRIGTEKHIAALKPILSDADVAVRVTAAGAIGRLLVGPTKDGVPESGPGGLSGSLTIGLDIAPLSCI